MQEVPGSNPGSPTNPFKIAGIATVFVAQGLTLEGFKVVMKVAHPPCVEGVTMPSTMGGISLFCPLQVDIKVELSGRDLAPFYLERRRQAVPDLRLANGR